MGGGRTQGYASCCGLEARDAKLRVLGLEIRDLGLGFRVWGLGFGVQGLGFWVWGLGFGVRSLGGLWMNDLVFRLGFSGRQG